MKTKASLALASAAIGLAVFLSVNTDALAITDDSAK